MKSLSNSISLSHQGIRIDKEGTWYYQGAEMIRKDILKLFYRHLKCDLDGRFLIEFEKERYYIEVDDTPYVIKSVTSSAEQGDETLYLHMPDDSIEKLDPTTLRVGKDNVLYCNIGKIGVKARFSRASYYQIARYFEHDPDKDAYYISLNGHSYEIGRINANYI